MKVWYNQRFDLIGLGQWFEDVFDSKSHLYQIFIKPHGDNQLSEARWGRPRTIKEWKKVDWVLIGEY